MNLIFTCGGTGGHINPAIALANTLRERDPNCKILFVGCVGEMEEQLVPKAELFRRCEKGVINADDSYAQRFLDAAECQVLTTAVAGEGSLRAEDLELRSDGIDFVAVLDGERVPVSLGIPGKFTVYNALSVLGIAKQLGVSLADCADALKTVQGVKGRIEVVPTPGKPYSVLIDYAHTPDGLENVLSSVRDFCKGRLIAVFGCGGDRDPIKRPIMGCIGTKLSDKAIITSDNPRTEDPERILDQVVAGAEAGRQTLRISDRAQAIRTAVMLAKAGDIILIAGKGHEDYIEENGTRTYFSEKEVVENYLSRASR